MNNPIVLYFLLASVLANLFCLALFFCILKPLFNIFAMWVSRFIPMPKVGGDKK